MTPRELPAIRTPATPANVFAGLVCAWNAKFSENPARKSVLVLLSQWSLETGQGKACWCWNLGNAKSKPGDGRSWTMLHGVTERINGVVQRFDPPSPQCRFRAFDSLVDGASDYLEMLHTRFAGAWPDVLAGDGADFARLLHEEHYYTAPESDYERLLMSYYHTLDASMPAS